MRPEQIKQLYIVLRFWNFYLYFFLFGQRSTPKFHIGTLSQLECENENIWYLKKKKIIAFKCFQ